MSVDAPRKHGGRRPGAGRKPLPPEDKRVRVTVPRKLKEKLSEWIDIHMEAEPND